jgi:hypothetical protein
MFLQKKISIFCIVLAVVSIKNYPINIYFYNSYQSTTLNAENIKWPKKYVIADQDTFLNKKNKINFFTSIGSGTTLFNKGLYYEGGRYFINSGWNLLSSVSMEYKKWSLSGIYSYTNYNLIVKESNRKEGIYKHSFLISMDYRLFTLFQRKLHFKMGLYIPVYDIYTNKIIDNYEGIKVSTKISFLYNVVIQINDKWGITLNYFKNLFTHYQIPLSAGNYKIHIHLINLGLSYKLK